MPLSSRAPKRWVGGMHQEQPGMYNTTSTWPSTRYTDPEQLLHLLNNSIINKY